MSDQEAITRIQRYCDELGRLETRIREMDDIAEAVGEAARFRLRELASTVYLMAGTYREVLDGITVRPS